jgi:hypothetical protein
MNDVELVDDLPKAYLEKAEKMGIEDKRLKGEPTSFSHPMTQGSRKEAERVVRYLKETVLPKVKAGG